MTRVIIIKLNNYKELDPVYYGYSGVILRNNFHRDAYQSCFHYHWHERMELILVHSGSIEVDFGIEKLLIGKNSVIIVPPYRLHGGYAGDEGAVFQTVMFDVSTFFNQTPASKSLLEPIVNLKVNFDFFSKNSELIQSLTELFSLKESSENESALFISAYIYKILGLLHKHCTISTEEISSQRNEKNLNDILNYIDKNLDENITLDSLAVDFGYSKEYLCRKFKTATGFTFSNYIKILRLEKAKLLLSKTDEKIGTVAFHCGFHDFSYFCRCFKEAYKISPSEYVYNKRNGKSQ